MLFVLPGKFSACVMINEICWMGDNESYGNEWIELKNNCSYPVNLDGWNLYSEDKIPDIFLSGTIGGNKYFLLERTDDNSAKEARADIIYTGGLNNSGENLFLKNKDGEEIDRIMKEKNGWQAGDNILKMTMERDGNGWHTSKNPGGTPKRNNSPGIIIKKQEKNEDEENEKVKNKSGGIVNIPFSFLSAAAIAALFSGTFFVIKKRL